MTDAQRGPRENAIPSSVGVPEGFITGLRQIGIMPAWRAGGHGTGVLQI
jgi:hypothetical protein